MSRWASFRDARCLVTGASSGLGEAIAGRLVREGARVVLTGRSQERLEPIARQLQGQAERPELALPFSADLTQPEDRTALLDFVAQRFDGVLDLLVNCAGVGAYGRFESHDPSILHRIFEINFFAVAELTRGALPMLRRGRNPALINLGSIVARRSLPGRSEYSASKFALAGLTDALRAELKIDGIHVLMVNPGFTQTAFERNLLVNTAIYSTQHLRGMSPADVAAATLRALQRGKYEVTLTTRGRLLLTFNRLMPRFVNWGFGLWTKRLYQRGGLRPVEAPATSSDGSPRFDCPPSKAE